MLTGVIMGDHLWEQDVTGLNFLVLRRFHNYSSQLYFLKVLR